MFHRYIILLHKCTFVTLSENSSFQDKYSTFEFKFYQVKRI